MWAINRVLWHILGDYASIIRTTSSLKHYWTVFFYPLVSVWNYVPGFHQEKMSTKAMCPLPAPTGWRVNSMCLMHGFCLSCCQPDDAGDTAPKSQILDP